MAKYRGPRRPLNVCKICEYTFYPRGKNISNKCPRCGANEIGPYYNGSLLDLVTLLLIAGGLVYYFYFR